MNKTKMILVAVAVLAVSALTVEFAPRTRAPDADVSFNLVWRGPGKQVLSVPLLQPHVDVNACDDETSCDVGPMTPPTNEKLFNLIFRGINISEANPETDVVGATPEAAFNTDLTSAQRNDSYTQETSIRNTSADFGGAGDPLCVGTVAWSGVSTCQTLCAASAFTCSGAATDGKVIPAGSELPRTWDGTNCICVVSDAGTCTYQVERLIR